MKTIEDIRARIEEERVNYVGQLETEKNESIRLNLEHNVKVCDKQLQEVELAEENAKRAGDVQKEWQETDDKDQKAFLNRQIDQLQYAQNNLVKNIEEYDDLKVDINALRNAFGDKAF